MILIDLFEDVSQKEKRLEFLRNKLEPVWQGLPNFAKLDAFLNAVADIDPTPKGTMMQWIATKAIKNPTLNKTEDFPRLKKDLENFVAPKNKLTNKDINSYKSFHDVFAQIEPFLKRKSKISAKQKQAKRLEKIREDIINVYKGPEGWIKIPETRPAACFLGQNTRWCTSARSGNMFDSYNKSDKLFVIFDKESGRRFQMHLNSGSFHNESDSPEGMQNVPEWARQHIKDWYISNNQNMNFNQLLHMSKMADVSELSGDHADLFKLMKEYE
jgi:hypothetical protein